MMKHEKIKAIYEDIAIIKSNYKKSHCNYCKKQLVYTSNVISRCNTKWCINKWTICRGKTFEKEVIKYYPVMIWDVLDFLDFDEWLQPDDIINIWNELRKPIEIQSEKTIDYIYNLIVLWKLEKNQ